MKRKTIIIALLFIATITANAQFIFRISGNGMEKPSYILGSLHVLSSDLLDSIPAFLEVENQCQQLYAESDVTDSQQKQARNEQGQLLVTLPDGKTITDVLGEERMKMLQERMMEEPIHRCASRYAHGPQGVVSQLREAGFVVEPVK